MHEQTSLFGEDAPPPRRPRDSKGARQAAQEAMEQISENTSPAWRNAAEQAVYRTCVAKAAFLVDDVWTEFERVDGDFAYAGVHDKRAMGPLVISAAKAGWCESTKTAQHSAIVGNLTATCAPSGGRKSTKIHQKANERRTKRDAPAAPHPHARLPPLPGL